MIQLRDGMKFNQKEDPSVDTSVSSRRGNKIIREAEGGEDLDRRGIWKEWGYNPGRT